MPSNSDNATVTPAKAAALVGVEVYTIRRWCDWHAAHLSAGASPGPGALRKLAMRDIEVLKTVREMREQGLTTLAINEQLAGFAFPEIETGDRADITIESAPISPDAPQSTPAAIVPHYDDRHVLSRLERLERSREPAFMMGFGLGVVVMGVLFLLLIGLAVLYGGFR